MKKNSTIILILLLVAMLGSMVHFGTQKLGYHVDEIYSYGLANSEFLPFLHFGYHDYDVKDWMMEYGSGESLGGMMRNLVKDFKMLKECGFNWRESEIYQDYLVAQAASNDRYSPTWVSGQYFMDYIAASESNNFNYISVYYNQRGDVHPPLYYIVLHTVCSIFQGVFTKWFGLGINFVFMILAMLLLYRTARKYLGGEVVALCSVAVYALSSGCMTNVVFMRMYVMLTFFMIAACLVHLRIVHNDFQVDKKERWLLLAVTLGGFLTQYYYVFFGIMLAMVMVVWMALGKRWMAIVRYVLTLAGTAVLGICVWPFAIKHIFFGYRGGPTWTALLSGDFSTYVAGVNFEQMAAAILGGKLWVLPVAALLGIAGVMMSPKRLQYLGKVAMVAFPVVGFSLMVAQITPFLTDRYIMGTYPLWCCLIVGSVYLFVRELLALLERTGKFPGFWAKNGRKVIGGAVALAAVLLMISNSCYLNYVGNLITGVQDTVEVPENTDCIYVLADGEWNQSTMDATILAKCRNVGVSYESDVSALVDEYTYQPGDYLMIAIQKEMDVDAVLAKMRTIFGVENVPEVYRTYGNTAVRVMLRSEK